MPYNYDEKIPEEVANALTMSFIQLNKTMILEGGAIELNGKGDFMATKSAILNKNRNPGMTQDQAESLLKTYLGATHFIWLEGVAGKDITDMHIDGFARFGENNQIITMSKADLSYWELSDKDIAHLYTSKNQEGEAYKYVILP